MQIYDHIKDRFLGKIPASMRRSSKWPKVRKCHLEKHPSCAVCGGNKKLNVHHIKTFADHPELELDESNLVTLCESGSNGINCHLFVGHLGNFQSCNQDVIMDAKEWGKKIKNRPP
jgi:hypothetical protein